MAVINDAMARAFWPNTNPLGQHVKLSRSATSWTTVVGIVAGIIISLVTRRVIMFERPVLRLFWSNEWVLRATLIAVVGALAGALYPALKAAQRDPIDALAYE